LRDGVDTLRAVATGPTRLRARLRRPTRPIRRSRRGARIGGLRTVFPAEIFGGELLGVLGERLRMLLAPPAPQTDEDAAVRSALRVARERRTGDVVVRPQPAPGATAADAPGLRARERAASSRLGPGLDRRESSGRTGFAALATPGVPMGGVPMGERSPLTGAALLEDRLRRYWIAVQAAALHAPERRAAAPSRRAAAPPREPRAELGARQPVARQSEADLARELHAFVKDTAVVRTEVERSPVPVDGDEPQWLDGEHVPSSTRRLGAPQRATPSSPRIGPTGLEPREHAAALRELAGEMATILREQAIRHGIDVP
jgi:hypothetical protein